MELRNPLTKGRLDALRPRPLVVDFDFNDISSGSLVAGTILAGYIAREVLLEITTPFDGGVQITIGDSVAQARLMAIADNDPTTADGYIVPNHYEYGSDTEVRVYFPGGSPTIGVGRAIIYVE